MVWEWQGLSLCELDWCHRQDCARRQGCRQLQLALWGGHLRLVPLLIIAALAILHLLVRVVPSTTEVSPQGVVRHVELLIPLLVPLLQRVLLDQQVGGLQLGLVQRLCKPSSHPPALRLCRSC